MAKVTIRPDMTVEEFVEMYPAGIRFLMERGIACVR